MIEPSMLSWAIVIFIILTPLFGARPEDFDDD